MRDSVELTTEKRCVVDASRQRCNKDDQCIIRCLLTGSGRNIGGGCWHRCFAYTGIRWTSPPGMEACDVLRQSPSRGNAEAVEPLGADVHGAE